MTLILSSHWSRRTQGQEQEESLRMFFGDRRSDLDLDEEATLQEVSMEKSLQGRDRFKNIFP